MNKLIALLLIGNIAFASSAPVKCDDALKACEDVIVAQDQAIENLKNVNKNLRQQLDSQSGTPRWIIFIGGIAAGIIYSAFVNK
ncbi:MAG: hypothetical protein EB120_06900 [Proteobacteria bacterium]|nr:hypothetical protein [Pseudomonadota bacterium]NDG26885.1 hypothetical protein [Pseudomonadota bacterium]